jgi:hypothetical protein
MEAAGSSETSVSSYNIIGDKDAVCTDSAV